MNAIIPAATASHPWRARVPVRRFPFFLSAPYLFALDFRACFFIHWRA